MLGTDGRLYDSDFDFDEDGKLNAYEYSVMDDLVFGHEDACTSDETELEDDLLLAGLNETELECMDADKEEKHWRMRDWIRMIMTLTRPQRKQSY